MPLQNTVNTLGLQTALKESNNNLLWLCLLLGGPQSLVLDYEPLSSVANQKRLLADLVHWVLSKRIHHRQAATVRGLIQMWIHVDEHERLDSLEKRIEQLEAREVTRQ
jgi:hypothetical protein